MSTSTFFIAYASSAATPFSEQQLTELLAVCRARNGEVDVTGLLLHRGGNFLQALEGPEEAVRATMLRIARDRRHRSIVSLYDGHHDERLFANWSMGFEQMAALDDARHPGLSRYLAGGNAASSQTAEEHDVFEFFRAFRDYVR